MAVNLVDYIQLANPNTLRHFFLTSISQMSTFASPLPFLSIGLFVIELLFEQPFKKSNRRSLIIGHFLSAKVTFLEHSNGHSWLHPKSKIST